MTIWQGFDVDAYWSLITPHLRRATELEQQVAALAAQLEAVRRDAERYRWLRQDAGFNGWGLPRVPAPCPDNISKCKVPHTREVSGAALDAAIDAARQQEAARES